MNQTHSYSIYVAALSGIALGLAAFVLYKISNVSGGGAPEQHDDDEENNGRKRKKGPYARNENNHNQFPSSSHLGDTYSGSEQKSPVDNIRSSATGNANTNNRKRRDVDGKFDKLTADVVTADGFTTLRMPVPKDLVGAIIGRQGCNIKQIQAETKTKIDFDNHKSEEEERIITIRGSEKGTQDAELRILHIVIGQQSKQTYTIQVPHGSLGFIIGKGGESIKRIQLDSQCQVKVVSSSSDRPDPTSLSDIKLTGSDVEIRSAVGMIEALVEEWDTKKNNARFAKEQSGPRRPASRRSAPAPIAPGSPLVCEQWPNHSDYIDCYVTATVNPTNIWLQLLSSAATKLEEINSSLCQLYSDPSQLVDDVISNRPSIGTTVAARNITEDLWYRGKIAAYREEGELSVDIYFLDYGDSCWMPLHSSNVQLLRPEFYCLSAQAIECYTDIILHPDCPEEWTSEQCDVFEKLTHTGDWSVLNGALIGWRPRQDGSNELLPVIKLVDTNTEEDIHISNETIKHVKSDKVGFGDLRKRATPSTNSTASAAPIPTASPEVLAIGSDRITLAPHPSVAEEGAEETDPSADAAATFTNGDRAALYSPSSYQPGGLESDDDLWD